ncbi:MAG: hypothetical protein ACRDE2_11380 [Chitinophagaceae bacterium]
MDNRWNNIIFIQKFYTSSTYPVRLPLIYKDKMVFNKEVNFAGREDTTHGKEGF